MRSKSIRRAAAYAGDSRWWRAKRDEASDLVVEACKSIRDQTKWLWAKDRYHAELYEGEGALDESSRGKSWEGSTLPYNVVRSACDTIQAKVAKERPLPQVYTNRASWGQQKRGRRASEALEGEYTRLEIFEDLAPRWVLDAELSRAGVLYVGEEGDSVLVERWLSDEFYVDPRDGKYGKPRCLHAVRTIDAAVLAERFPAKKKEIYASRIGHSSEWDRDGSWDDGTTDRVRVFYAWRLPTRATTEKQDGTHDGRYVLCIDHEDGTLCDEEFDEDDFPFVFLRYAWRRRGFWGTPLAEILEGFQYEINTMAEAEQEAFHMCGKGVVLVPQGSEILETDLTNGVAAILRHKPGMAPQWVNPEPIHPAFTQRRRELPEDALNFSGVSVMSARSERPQGIDSAKGLQVLDDVETERFAMFVRAYQAAHVKLGQKILKTIKRIADRTGDYEVQFQGRRGVRDLSWTKDFSLEDGYTLKVFSTSVLSKRPEARFQQLEYLDAKGYIDEATFWRLSEMPDLGAETDVRLAPKLRVHDHVEQMIEAEPESDQAYEDFYPYPDAYLDLAYAQQYTQQQLNRALQGKAPEGVLKLLQQYIEDAAAEEQKQLAKAQAQTAGASVAGPQGAPPADPGLGAPPVAAPFDQGMPMGPGFPPAPMPGDTPMAPAPPMG